MGSLARRLGLGRLAHWRLVERLQVHEVGQLADTGLDALAGGFRVISEEVERTGGGAGGGDERRVGRLASVFAPVFGRLHTLVHRERSAIAIQSLPGQLLVWSNGARKS